jgi:hypothetical protein
MMSDAEIAARRSRAESARVETASGLIVRGKTEEVQKIMVNGADGKYRPKGDCAGQGNRGCPNVRITYNIVFSRCDSELWFEGKETEELFQYHHSKRFRAFERVALRKLLQLHAATELRIDELPSRIGARLSNDLRRAA